MLLRKKKNESTYILWYNLQCTSKHRPSRERTASNLTGSEDSRGKPTSLPTGCSAITQVFRQTESENIQVSRQRNRQST